MVVKALFLRKIIVRVPEIQQPEVPMVYDDAAQITQSR